MKFQIRYGKSGWPTLLPGYEIFFLLGYYSLNYKNLNRDTQIQIKMFQKTLSFSMYIRATNVPKKWNFIPNFEAFVLKSSK